MDRNREARRSGGMVAAAATSNGLSSRRRHRTNSLRDSQVQQQIHIAEYSWLENTDENT